jgi:NDMA-dependent alcohol dehydrogenase
MQTRAAILWEGASEWNVEPIELDLPQRGDEVLVRLAASGLCHSDEHALTGDLPMPRPLIGGHEGAGIVEAVGPGCTAFQPGDAVVFGFIPACGGCPSCATGHSNLCDIGASLLAGRQMDGSSRHHARGEDLNTMVCLGTFSEHTVVNVASCVKVPDDVPLDRVCLLGCGVTTGWGSAVYAADVRPGENVAVLGVGGIGASAVQGARLAGAERIFAIDPVEWKRSQAARFGATHTAATVEEAFALIQEVTWGRMADKVICAMGVGRGESMVQVMALAAKRGKVVITNIHPMLEVDTKISFCDITLMEKQVIGSLFGSANIRSDIPKLIELYRQGQLDLDGLVTRTYKLVDVNQGYQDMRDGLNIRGVLVYDQ